MFISGNANGLGNYQSSVNMNMIIKKKILSDKSVPYFEKSFYLPADKVKLLNYNYYTQNANSDSFESNQQQRKVLIDFDYYYPYLYNDEFDSPRTRIQKTHTYIFRSPINKEKEYINYEQHSPNFIEIKYNTLIIYDKMEDRRDISFDICENVSLGIFYTKYLNLSI